MKIIIIAGLGPGSPEDMTPAVMEAVSHLAVTTQSADSANLPQRSQDNILYAIHTTADFDMEDILYFDDAAQLKSGRDL